MSTPPMHPYMHLIHHVTVASVALLSLATWLGPLRRFVLAHPWDVDVEGCSVLLERSPKGEAEAEPNTPGYSLRFFRRVLRKRYDSEPVSMMCA